jgi:UDP:flavonoid glycosyltransferase YjiC (YdhE family)
VEAAGFQFQLSRRAFSYGLEETHELPYYNIHDSYKELIAALAGADLLISHQVAFAAPLAVAITETPWVSVMLSPFMFGSAYQDAFSLHAMSPTVLQLSFVQLNALHKASQIYTQQVNTFRRELGLAPGRDVLLSDHLSPHLVLALFSSTFAKSRSEWPRQTCVTGFPFDNSSTASDDQTPEIERFIAQGSPPIVFTLGSASVFDSGTFRAASVGAARLLGRRAILLGSVTSGYAFPDDVDLISVDYAPHGSLFARAAAVVHHAGIGTTAAAMRAGCPMLLVPGFAWDQPDNAARAVGLGIARALTLAEYTAASAARELRHLLSDPGYANNSARVRRAIEKENGADVAVDAIERYLQTI